MVPHGARRFFSSAAPSANLFQPRGILNFKAQTCEIFRSMDSTGRLVHSLKNAKIFVLTCGLFTAYRAFVSYRKKRTFRFLFFWTPMSVLFALALRSRVNSINHVKAIRLRANGTHVDIQAHFPS